MKTERLGLVVTKREKQLVSQLAQLEGGLSQASLIRRLIHKAAEEYALLKPLNQAITQEEEDYE
jgi:hypothetical protein